MNECPTILAAIPDVLPCIFTQEVEAVEVLAFEDDTTEPATAAAAHEVISSAAIPLATAANFSTPHPFSGISALYADYPLAQQSPPHSEGSSLVLINDSYGEPVPELVSEAPLASWGILTPQRAAPGLTQGQTLKMKLSSTPPAPLRIGRQTHQSL